MDHILSLCTGIGGLDIGLHAGLRAVGRSPRTVCMVEREAFAVACLGAAIQEGRMDEAPIWCGDIRDFPGGCLARVDWICGGYPCQPFSAAGKRRGEDDPRHLWPVILGLVREIRPAGVLFENVAGHISLGLFDVLSDLESSGYRTAWGCYSAASVGAPHRRERVFILGLADAASVNRGSRSAQQEDREESSARGELADADGDSESDGPKHAEAPRMPGVLADAYGEGSQRRNSDVRRTHQWPSRPSSPQRSHEPSRTIEPRLGRNAHGLPDRVDRLRALGNSVVPQQAEMAFIDLWNQLQ